MLLNRLLLPAALFLTACASVPAEPPAHDLHAEVRGDGEPLIVFINGNGATLSVWDGIEAALREDGVTALLTDRDGLGGTALGPRPYRIEDEIASLRATIAKLPDGPQEMILVAHSYGGLIAAGLADEENVAGVVLVDALVPGAMTQELVEETLATYRPQYEAVRKQAPDVAAAIIPIVEAYPETADAVSGMAWPNGLTLIIIEAENPAGGPATQAATRSAYRRLIAENPGSRTLVIAERSGHQVMRDRPDLVVEAIRSLIKEMRAEG
ncbi:alpha/beta fold hydrolase [Parvularcula mediterranea]|nr:alpha/beta hydrolase [Parvularcula mediterranea]